MKHLFKKKFLLLAQVVVSIGLLFFIFRKIDISYFSGLIHRPDPVLLILAFVLFLAALLSSSLKWSLLANNVFSLNLSFKYFVSYNLVGGFYSIFVPGGTMIGEGVKAWRLSKKSDTKGRLFLSVAIDRIVGFVAMGLIILVIFIVDPLFRKDTASVFGFFMSLIFVSLGLILLFLPRLVDSIMEMILSLRKLFFRKYILLLREYMKDYHAKQGIVLTSILVAACSHLLVAGAIYKIAEAVMIPAPFLLILWAYLISLVLTFVPISYAGLGIREGVFVYFFLLVGIPKEHTLSISILYFGLLIFFAIIGGVIEFKELWLGNIDKSYKAE